jgi:hypothetical protein
VVRGLELISEEDTPCAAELDCAYLWYSAISTAVRHRPFRLRAATDSLTRRDERAGIPARRIQKALEQEVEAVEID